MALSLLIACSLVALPPRPFRVSPPAEARLSPAEYGRALRRR